MTNDSGVAQRARTKENDIEKLKTKAKRIALQTINLKKLKDAENSEELQLLFNEMWLSLDNKLKNDKVFKMYEGYVEGHNEAVKYTQDIIENEGINVGFPKLIVSSYRPKSFRTETWFYDAKKTLGLYLDWIDILENNEDICLNDIMLSLVFHSAVLRKVEIEQILSDIEEDSIQLISIYGLPVITVIIKDDSYDTNIYINKEFKHQVNVFLSPITARMINNYTKQDPSTDLKRYVDIHTLYKSMWQTKFKGVSTDYIGIKRFLLSAVYVLEEMFDFHLPEHTWYLMIGFDNSYGLSTLNWQSFVYNVKHSEDRLTTNTETVKKKNGVKRTIKLGLAVDIAKTLKREGVSKVPIKRFKLELNHIYNELIDTKAPLNEIAILSWLIKKTRSCTVNSIRTYSNTIVYRWLSISQNMDLTDFNEEDFVKFYTELIELGSTDKAKNSIATHIDDIHALLVTDFDIEPIAPFSENGKKHHKTGYISENMFQAVLIIIDSNKLDLHQEERNALKVALILGQRCGLRIGEMVKIRLKDTSSILSFVDIRDNKYGNNKTSSALRRVLLEELLTDLDKELLKQVYAKRVINNHDTLIASQTGQPYKAQDLSRMLSHLIKQATGIKQLTTHHLRHSCLTNLQLMSFLNDCPESYHTHECFKSLLTLLPYDFSKVENITKIIQTPLSYKKIHALAGVAGHAKPKTTFASYVHLIDIQIGLKLWFTNFKFHKGHARVLSVSRRNNSLLENTERLNSYLMNKMKKSFPNINKPKAIKLTISLDSENKSRRYGFDEVTTILSKYADNDDVHYWLKLLDIDENTLETWLSNANNLKTNSKFRTQQKFPRLFDIKDNVGLLPSLDRFNEDREIFSRMTTNYRELYYSRSKKRIRPLLAKFVLYTLTHSQFTKNHIKFDQAGDLEDYLEIVNKLVFKKDLKLTIYNYQANHDGDMDKWSKVLTKVKPSQIKYKSNKADYCYRSRIRAELSLTSQTAEDRVENKKLSTTPINGWTVRTLQIFCHYVYIMIGNQIESNRKE